MIAPIVAATALGGLLALILPVPKPGLTLGQFDHAWPLAAGALCLGRLAIARRGATQFSDVRLTLIVGAGRVGRMIEQRLRREPGLGLDPAGFVDDDPLFGGDGDAAAPVLGGMGELEQIIRTHNIRHVLIAFSKASEDELLDAVRHCERLGDTVAVVPRLFELAMRQRDVPHLGCIPLVGVRRSTPTRAQASAKDLVDRVATLVDRAEWDNYYIEHCGRAEARGCVPDACGRIGYRRRSVGYPRPWVGCGHHGPLQHRYARPRAVPHPLDPSLACSRSLPGFRPRSWASACCNSFTPINGAGSAKLFRSCSGGRAFSPDVIDF